MLQYVKPLEDEENMAKLQCTIDHSTILIKQMVKGYVITGISVIISNALGTQIITTVIIKSVTYN